MTDDVVSTQRWSPDLLLTGLVAANTRSLGGLPDTVGAHLQAVSSDRVGAPAGTGVDLASLLCRTCGR